MAAHAAPVWRLACALRALAQAVVGVSDTVSEWQEQIEREIYPKQHLFNAGYGADRCLPGDIEDVEADFESIDREISREWLGRVINELFEILKPREVEVIKYHFGFNGICLTLEQIGAIFDITGPNVRQIEIRALNKLRHPIHSRKLRGFLDE